MSSSSSAAAAVAAVLLVLACASEAKVCGTVDVRSEITELEKLNECTVIVGSLSILLIEKADYPEFERYSFPELTEINGYLLMYRVFKLRTLATLFPNLSVIRGQTLFEDFAFVLFEMPELEEVSCCFFLFLVTPTKRYILISLFLFI